MRGSPEPGADLISRGQLFAVHIWQRAAAVPPPPRPACVTFQECWQRLAHLERVSGGSRRPLRRPLRRLARAGGGRPARISWLLPPLAAGGGSQAAPRLDHGTGKGSRTWLSPCGAGGP